MIRQVFTAILQTNTIGNVKKGFPSDNQHSTDANDYEQHQAGKKHLIV